MKRLLLTASDQQDLRTRLTELGGTLLMRLAGNLYVVNVPMSTDPAQVAGVVSGQAAMPQLDEQAAEMAGAWQDAERSMATASSERPGHRLAVDDSHEAPWCVTPLRKAPRTPAERAAARAATTPYAVGSVALGLVMVSGPGRLAFSQGELRTIRAQVAQGITLLQNENPLAKLEFHIDDRPVTVDVPPPRNCNFPEDCEAPWRNAALVKLGYPGDLSGTTQYINALRQQFGTTWGYVAYFTKYPLPTGAAGYMIAGWVVISYANGSFGPNRLYFTFSHESCHVFGAGDEYKESRCTCFRTWGFFDTANCNCGNCPGEKFSCLMNKDGEKLCTWTRRQIGWNAWSPQTDVTAKIGAKTNDGPAAAAFAGRVYIAYKGESSFNLWMASYDGTTWFPQTNITDINGAKTAVPPALAAVGDRLYMVWRGDTTASLWMAYYNGTTWSRQTNISNINGARSGLSPAIAALGNQLYMVWQAEHNSDLWMASYNGTTWTRPTNITQINEARTGVSPALAALGSRLYLVYGGEQFSTLYSAYYDGNTWSRQTNITDINGAKSNDGPAAYTLGNNLVVAYRGDTTTNLWSCVFDGSSWLGQVRIADQNGAATRPPPALCGFGDGLQLVYRGYLSNNLWSCHYAPDAPQQDSLQGRLWRTC